MNVSVVIPNYNGQNILKKNLPKVMAAVRSAEIIVVDDASTDMSVSVVSNLKSQISNLKLIQNEKNLGFSSTVNKGVKESIGEIVILLNTDVRPEEDFLEPLLSHFKDEKIFAVGCMDKSIENKKTILRGRGIGFWKRGFFVHNRGEVNKTNTLWVSGGSGAFRKTIWYKLGGLDVLYNPFYWEDIDLSYRALKSGYKILFEPKSIVIHEHEKGVIKSSFTKFTVKTISYRNQLIFVWKNITDLSMQFEHLLWFPYHIFSAVIRRDLAFFNGLFRAIVMFPQVILKSFKSQRLFKATDREILDEFRNEK